MTSFNNIKDATRLLPSWAAPTGLTFLIVLLYALAYTYYQDRPNELVSLATAAVIVLSIVGACVIAFMSILRAQAGQVAAAINDGFTSGLTFAWASSSVALATFVTAATFERMFSQNQTSVLVFGGAAAMLAIGYMLTKPKQNPPADENKSMSAVNMLALPAQFQGSSVQTPAFQITIADLTRLVSHQAGRAIAYKGSQCLIDDSFSIELDINARTSKFFNDTSYVNTRNFIYWRMHMMLMGAAAERVLLQSTSEASIDDFSTFDDLAAKYLALHEDRTFTIRPMNEFEASIKLGRIAMIRKTIWSRCVAAAQLNHRVLEEMVKLMRAQSCLSYSDIKSLLDRVEMPDGFPIAEFDTDDVLHRALLICEEVESDTVAAPESASAQIDSGNDRDDGHRMDAQSNPTSTSPILRAVN
jgi:hypothetical protein